MRFKKTTALIIFFLASFLTVEIYLQIRKPSLVEFDPELGWKLKSNFDRTYHQKTQQGREYSAHFQTNEYGFRTNGTNSENSLKILVLGDSFTADAFTSNDEAWFSVMAKKLEADKNLGFDAVTVWAGGSGGYGTLQELILARRIKKYFKPDVLILQFCINDFTDNSLELEKNTFLRQLYLRRPYLGDDGEIKFNQGILAAIYRSRIFENSRILNKIDSIINTFEYMYYRGYSKTTSTKQELQNQSTAKEITERLLNQFHQEFKDMPNIMINCSTEQSDLNSHWINLAKNTGFQPISVPSEMVAYQLKHGSDMLHADGGHWNVEGNRVVGESLASEISMQIGNKNIIKK